MRLQNHFSLKRFYKALQYDLALNARTYMFFVIGLFVALIIVNLFYIINAYDKIHINDYTSLFFVPYIISIVIVVGTSFPMLRNKKSAQHYLMLPASVFEKFLVQFVIRGLAYFMVFMVLFWLDFKIAKAIYNLFEWRQHTHVGTFTFLDQFNHKGFVTTLDVLAALCWLLSLVSFLLAGAVYFKKYALFKAILSFVLIIGIGIVVMAVFSSIYYPERFYENRNLVYMNDYKISEHLFNTQFLFYVIGMVSSLFLLPLAYFKLKEREL